MGPRGGGGGFGFLHMIVGMISAAILVALFVALVLLILKFAVNKGWIRKPKHGPHHGPHHGGPHPEPGAPHAPQPGPADAQRILDERLARGEIEIDDYRARRDALAGTGYPPFHQPPTPPAPPAGDPETRLDEHPPHVPPAQ